MKKVTVPMTSTSATTPFPFDSALAAVLAFAVWTLFHIGIIGFYRVTNVQLGRAKPNSFPPSRNEPQTTFYGRVCASHVNCVENLVVFSAVILSNYQLNTTFERNNNFDSLAWTYFYFRIGQSLVHWYDCTSEAAVTIRFFCFGGQLICLSTIMYLMVYG